MQKFLAVMLTFGLVCTLGLGLTGCTKTEVKKEEKKVTTETTKDAKTETKTEVKSEKVEVKDAKK